MKSSVNLKIPDKGLAKKYLDTFIVRDEAAKWTTFYTCCSAYTNDPINQFMTGESGIGKTYIATTVARLFPPEDVWKLGGLSPKALVYSKGVLEDEHGNVIDLSQKPRGDDEEAVAEWNERLRNARRIVDLHGKIIIFLEAPPKETLDVLRPILSHDSWETEYRSVDKEKSGRLTEVKAWIRGWPATIFCTARVAYLEEMATRSFTVSPEASEEKYREAMRILAKMESDASFRERWRRVEEMFHEHFRRIRDAETRILNPFATMLAESFPAVRTRSMRDFSHFLSLVKAVTLFNYTRRPCVYGDGEKILIATAEDVEEAERVFANIRRQTVYGLPEQVLRFYDMIRQLPAEFSVRMAAEKWNQLNPRDTKSNETVKKWLYTLEAANLVSSEPDPLDKRRMLYTCVGENQEKAGYSGNTGFLGLFSLMDFKNWLKTNPVIGNGRSIHVSLLSPKPASHRDVYLRVMGFRKEYANPPRHPYVFPLPITGFDLSTVSQPSGKSEAEKTGVTGISRNFEGSRCEECGSTRYVCVRLVDHNKIAYLCDECWSRGRKRLEDAC